MTPRSLSRRMRGVAVDRVACRQPPAIGAVALEAAGIGDAVRAVDQRMRDVLLKIVGIAVRQPARVEPEERIVGEEERPAEIRPERQPDAEIVRGRSRSAAARPAAMIDVRRRSDASARTRRAHRRSGTRSSRGSHGSSPSRASGSSASRARRRLACTSPTRPRATACRSVARSSRSPPASPPKYWRTASSPAIRNAVSTRSPPSSLGLKGCALPVRAVEPVREGAVKAIALGEETHRMEQALERGFAPDPAALDADDGRHDTEAGAAARHDVGLAIAALARQPADRMREIPKIPERPPLDEIEQRHVRSREIRKANWSGGHVAWSPASRMALCGAAVTGATTRRLQERGVS